MTELSFAKSFLTTLDARPIKLQSDHAIDLRTFEPKSPYTLPRMPLTMRRAPKPAAPGSSPAVSVSLKSLRNPPVDLTYSSQSTSTSVLELKQKVATSIGASADKIRLLYKKKPCGDAKSIKDLIGEEGGREIEFSVMVMGGAVETDKEKEKEVVHEKGKKADDTVMEDAPIAQGESGMEVLEKEEFWVDLKGFLEQRVRNAVTVEEAAKLFQEVWKERGTTG